jgi:3alpha(or 20beta)-hydroxysteroid dehydrogenase
MTQRLSGSHALVTGGSRGIGEAVCERFVQEGAKVLIASRDASLGHDVADRLGDRATWAQPDIRDALGWQNLVERTADDPFDILVNNAGGLRYPKPLLELELDEWRDELETNLTGAFLGMRAVLPGMVARHRGSIINIGSISGVRAQGDAAGYAAAKGGLRLLTRHVAFTYASLGVRANLICPGAIATASVAAEPMSRIYPFVNRTPMRWARCSKSLRWRSSLLAMKHRS